MDAMIENDRGILYMHQEDLENALLCFQEGLQLVRKLQRTSCANKRHLPRNSKFIIPLVSDENGEMKSNLSSNDASYHVFPYPIALQSCQIESFAQGDVIPCIDRLSGVLKFNFGLCHQLEGTRQGLEAAIGCYQEAYESFLMSSNPTITTNNPFLVGFGLMTCLNNAGCAHSQCSFQDLANVCFAELQGRLTGSQVPLECSIFVANIQIFENLAKLQASAAYSTCAPRLKYPTATN